MNDCNHFLSQYSGAAYGLLEECINEFVWGLEQIDIPTGFEQFTTALEMILLEHYQKCKKQVLANRVAVLLGTNQSDVQNLYQKMTQFYRLRSESLHDGNGSNVTQFEFRELEEITRQVLRKCLIRCKNELLIIPNTTWDEIKASLISELKSQVLMYKNSGVLPP